MSNYYFIDSENVGDNWVFLLDTIAEDDAILVFYTSKSPHMNYKNLVKLKKSPKDVIFIECYEGNNALDFQLCTELGYRVHDINDIDEFIVVTNDTGYDAVIKYWNKRNIAVKRIPGNSCTQDQQSVTIQDVPENPSIEVNLPAPTKSCDDGIPDEAKEILCIFGMDQLPQLYQALQQLYGKKGKNYYKVFKSDTAYSDYCSRHKTMSLAEKQKKFCMIVFAHAASKVVMPPNFPSFVTETWTKKKNLNSFRSSLQAKYGKEASETYYSLFKTHIKILDKIK